MTNYLFIILTAGVLALVGCGKSSDKAPPPLPAGVVDVTVLRQAFPTPTPEITTSLDKLRFATRYRQFEVAVIELDKLAQLPDLTEAQKKAVNDTLEQIKAAIAAVTAQPAQ